MSISWIAPAALAGLGLIALPIAVHLLVRQLARRLPFPSLRFLQETQLAALRRRAIQDAGLLACRVAIVAVAVLALAGPVVNSAARTAAFSARTSRAIVLVDEIDELTVGRMREGAFKTDVFRRANIRDAIADGLRWLDAQPPSAREMVIAGATQRGSITDAEVSAVPRDIGLRFQPVTRHAPSKTVISILTRRNRALMKVEHEVTMRVDATTVVERAQSPLPADFVTIVAREESVDLANAALAAALDEGIPWTDFTTPVIVAWEGATPSARANARVISMAVPNPAASAARGVYDALVRGAPQPKLVEPIAISAEQLAQWSRPPGAVSTNAPLTDEGDRRWLWAAVLILMIVETWLRRSAATAAAQHEEARVA